MSLFEQFETDKDIEISGIELQYATGEVFTIRRAGGANKKFGKEFTRRIANKYQHVLSSKNISDKLDSEIDTVLMGVYADTVLLGWQNVKNREGEDLEYTRGNFVWLMTELPELWADFRGKCMDAELFKKYLLEETEKN